MSTISAELWSKLESPRASGDKLVARHAFPELTERLYCAVDSDRGRHLLIVLSPDEDEVHDSQSRGLLVDTRQLGLQGDAPRTFVDIQCRDSLGFSMLDLMGGEIADGLKDATEHPSNIIRLVLAKWRRFWGHVPQQMMSREQQLGLFAELWFLSVWLIPKSGPDVVSSWRGPWGARHDFEWPDKSVEVKSTSNSRGRVLHINGINQLERPQNGELYVFSVVLREDETSTNSLPTLIGSCHEQLRVAGDALTYFEDGLVRVGYSPVQENEYSKLHVGVVETLLFQVDAEFPRLVTATFPAGIPSGVESLEYDINLNTFNHLITASRPEESPL
jgi:hypothetical protein